MQEDEGSGLVLQAGKVVKIAQADGDVLPISKEAGAVLAKTVELFLSEMSRMAFENRQKAGAKQIEYGHVALAVQDWPATAELLQDIVPQKQLGAVVLDRLAREQQQENAATQEQGS